MMIPAISGGVLLPWNKATFANASPRRIWDASGKVLYGQFAGDTAAIANIGGKNRVQIEGARTNDMAVFGSWTGPRGTAAFTSGQTDPLGGTAAYLLTGINTGANTNDTFHVTIGGTNNAVQAHSIFIERVSTTGTFIISHPATGVADGDWSVGLSLFGNGWERLTPQHPAVTVRKAFEASAVGSGGFHIRGESGNPSDFYLYMSQQEDNKAFPSSPIAEGTTRAADSLWFAAGAVPTAFRSGKWSVEATLQFKGGDLANSDQHMLFYNDTSNFLCVEKTAGGVYQVRMATSSGDLTRIVTNSRDDTVIITPDYAGGNLTVANFTTGDGTASGTVSDLPVSTLHVGTNGANEKHAYMLLSEPSLAA